MPDSDWDWKDTLLSAQRANEFRQNIVRIFIFCLVLHGLPAFNHIIYLNKKSDGTNRKLGLRYTLGDNV